MFPDFIQQYLREANLPIYADLSKEKIISGDLKKEINGRKFGVAVSESNQSILRNFGVIQEEAVGTEALVELQHIDPIYAITNDSSLSENKEFCSRKQKYESEIGIVLDVLEGRNEPNLEWRSHIKFV